MNISPEAHVVGQVPADVVGVLVNDDIVSIPVPIIAETDIVGGDAEVGAAKPEATGTASGEMPDMTAAKTAGEVSVLPWVVEMIVRIVGTGIVANPFSVGVYMGCVGMAGLVVEMTVGLSGSRRRRGANWRGTVGGYMPASGGFGDGRMLFVLRPNRNRKQHADCEHWQKFIRDYAFDAR